MAGYGVPDLKGFLRGSWSLARIFVDRHRGCVGTLTGFAGFTEHSQELLYDERGALAFGGFHTAATRRYRYAFPQLHRGRVMFADGRAFHDLDLSQGRWSACHACGDDRYHGHFAVLTQREWEVSWIVSGPRKNSEDRIEVHPLPLSSARGRAGARPKLSEAGPFVRP